MSERERTDESERERERAPRTNRLSRPRKNLIADMSAEERFYSRSLKIRLAVMECLAKLSRKNSHHQNQPAWDSFEDLAGFCANYVFDSDWDSKPASIVTCARWCKQYFHANGLFQTVPLGSGSFAVNFRTPDSDRKIRAILREFQAKRRRKPPEKREE